MQFSVHQDLLRALNLILPFSWRQTIQSTFVKVHMYIISIMFLLNNSKNIRKYAIWIAGCCEGSAAGNKAWNEHLCCSVRPKPLFFLGLIPIPKPKLADTFGPTPQQIPKQDFRGKIQIIFFSIIKGPLKPNLLPITAKLGYKERFDKEQIGIKEPFPVTNLLFTLQG